MARQARCICGKINPSDEALPGYKSLPFFEARGPGSPWSLDTCVHCRFAARAHEPFGCLPVGLVLALVTEVPGVDFFSAFAERVVAALVRSGDESIERDRHVAGRVQSWRPFLDYWALQVPAPA